MTQPVRLLLDRRKGFNLRTLSRQRNGLGVAVVARPTRWGNPFIVWRDDVGNWIVTEKRAPSLPHIRHKPETPDRHAALRLAVKLHREWLDGTHVTVQKPPSKEVIIKALRGKNLACWCPYNGACHADTLLEIANAPVCEAVEDEWKPSAADVRAAFLNFRKPWDFRREGPLKLPLPPAPRPISNLADPVGATRLWCAVYELESGYIQERRALRIVGRVPGTDIEVELEVQTS